MKLRIDKRKLKYVGIVLLALIGSFMFHVDRSDNMDFNRYQTIMDSLRSSIPLQTGHRVSERVWNFRKDHNGFIKVIRHFLVGLHGKL